MRALFTFTYVLLATISQGQCDYEKNQVDSYTGAKLVETRANIALDVSKAIDWRFRSVDGTYLLQCRWSNSGVRVIGADDACMVKLEDGTVLTFESKGIWLPEHNDLYSWVWATYEADSIRFAQMAEKAVVGVRVYGSGSYLEWNVTNTRKNQEKIRKAAGCLIATP